jgi:Chaperone of endosialidase
MTTLRLKQSIDRSPWRLGFLLIPLVLACFALLPSTQAVTPAPDGGYPGGNTAEGANALLSRTTGGFDTAIGAASLLSLTTGGSNTAVGTNSLRLDTSGGANTAVGVSALFHNNGNSNTAVGANALTSNTTGTQNVAIGQAALGSNNASGNVAVGFQALALNSTGGGNTATGFQALSTNTTAPANTANGAFALGLNTTGSANTAVGFAALGLNRFAGTNTAIGAFALGSSVEGADNTAIGFAALENSFGSANIALGSNAGINLNGHEGGDIYIDNFGVAGESATTRIGSGQTRTFIAGIRGRRTGVANAIPVLIDSAGQLGTASSSQRFKHDIEPMDQTSESILALKPVTFHYKSDDTNTPQFGLIAEEVAKVNPDLVVRDENGQIYTVRYDAVNAMLLNEFLKEHRRAEEEACKLENLEATVAQQQKDFAATTAQQAKEIRALTASLKEQAAEIQKVSTQIEVTKPAPQVVNNDQ